MARSVAARFIALAALVVQGARGVSAQSDCAPGIVAACVLGTFGGCAVAATAATIYLLLRRRSRRRRRLGVVDRLGKSPFKSYANGAFATESSDSIAFTFGQQVDGKITRTDGSQWNHSKKCLGKQHRHDNGVKIGALDDACQPLQKCVTADLLSKDFGGLGLDISSSYTGGVFVKQLQDLGPAKQCGLIDVGDRIVSITVSFENIVYDDAAMILSRASPYHVRLHLLKQQHNGHQRVDVSESSPAHQTSSQVEPANGKPGFGGGSGLLPHPAFVRSQSVGTGAAVTGQLFRESLLCYDNVSRSNVDCTIDLDEGAGSSMASDSSVSLPRPKTRRTATLASNASVTALPGTVRLDSAEAIRVSAMVHGSPPLRGSAHSGLSGSAVSSSVGASRSLRVPPPEQHELEPSQPEHKGLLWAAAGGGGGARAGSSSSSGGDRPVAAATPLPAVPAPTIVVSGAPSPSLPPPLLQQPGPPAPDLVEQPEVDEVSAVTSVTVVAQTEDLSHPQGSVDLQPVNGLEAAAAVAGTTDRNVMKAHISSHSLELQDEDGMAEDALPAPDVNPVALHAKWLHGLSTGTSDSRLTGSAGSSPVPGGMRVRGTTTYDASPDISERHSQRPRHLPTAVMDLVQKKDAASAVLGQLEAFATLTRNNNNPGSKQADRPSQFKMQMNNASITIGLIQTPEDESSILAAVLNAAKMTDEVNSSDDEGSSPKSKQQQHRSRLGEDGTDSSNQAEQAEEDQQSLTTAAEIRALAAKFGTIERPRRAGAETSARSVPTSGAGPAVVPPVDPRSAEEARANYFSSMLRAAKS